jgi:oligoribonuclease
MSQATPSAVPGTPQRPNEFNLVWLDMEMTGLDPDNDRIIEVAVVVTDPDLNIRSGFCHSPVR